MMENEGIKYIKLFGIPTLILLIILIRIGFPWGSGADENFINIIRIYVFALFIGVSGCLLFFGFDSYLTRFEVRKDTEVVHITPFSFFSIIGLLGILGSTIIFIGCAIIILLY
jgi:hypothetical protein